MITRVIDSYWANIYITGPLIEAEQLLREECMRDKLCVTITPTKFIYDGAEEIGYMVGLVNSPRFPISQEDINTKADHLAKALLARTHQHSAMIVSPDKTTLIAGKPK